MRKITAVSVRPNVNVDFYENSAEHKDWFRANYIDTGLCHIVDHHLTIDLLTSTIVFLWKSNDDYLAFKREERAAQNIKERKAYNKEHGITRDVTRVTVSEVEGERLINARMDYEKSDAPGKGDAE